MITRMTTTRNGPPPPDHPHAAAWWLIQRHEVLVALCQRLPGAWDHDAGPDEFPFDTGVIAAAINSFDALATSGKRADLGDRLDRANIQVREFGYLSRTEQTRLRLLASLTDRVGLSMRDLRGLDMNGSRLLRDWSAAWIAYG